MTTLNLTKAQRRTLPRLRETEGVRLENKIAVTKFFTPWSNWTWYVIEFDGYDTCWGLVRGFHDEYGYFLLSELRDLEGPGGLKVERDIHFEPIKIRELGIPFTY